MLPVAVLFLLTGVAFAAPTHIKSTSTSATNGGVVPPFLTNPPQAPSYVGLSVENEAARIESEEDWGMPRGQ
ncbi:hypothetical protein EJ05DRAFT_476997 [Pseudovirgaria hyperparasitica]|uniref:Uncharacterized protein n=1 Tax=Pseudovirgaria hyperparasitica TaxID=470096 RepID=A0A6A6W881_9PEZI|nr:uncharacterized protein EJ05DRAFT_476997 [Pseudovirgaria hyperparasitica]KAF2757787.1 hypothetical protein EJ05DRAFT_476997 [Pseudovirgaria hyperparasitica]